MNYNEDELILIKELESKKVDKYNINLIMETLKTEKQLSKMIDYMISIRELNIPEDLIVEIADSISVEE